MGSMASQITSLAIVYSTVYSDADQRKHQSSASLAFVWGSHRGPVNSWHKWPVTRKMFPFDDVIMKTPCKNAKKPRWFDKFQSHLLFLVMIKNRFQFLMMKFLTRHRVSNYQRYDYSFRVTIKKSMLWAYVWRFPPKGPASSLRKAFSWPRTV